MIGIGGLSDLIGSVDLERCTRKALAHFEWNVVHKNVTEKCFQSVIICAQNLRVFLQ
jgi:hypothetical protein